MDYQDDCMDLSTAGARRKKKAVPSHAGQERCPNVSDDFKMTN